MKVTEHIVQADKCLFSFEILPPLKGQDINAIYHTVENLLEFNPPFIDVTYHREEYQYVEKAGGLLEKRVVRKRPGTLGICAALQSKYDVDMVPHVLCGGFTKEDTENFLIDLDFLGINNVVALRGDAVSTEVYFKPEQQGHSYASELVAQINGLNKGHYLDEELKHSHATDFCIGVGGYPEKHMEAPSLENDIAFLKQKVDSGADYIITQMFFDNQKYFEFVDRCRKEGINCPIIPGLKPISTIKQLSLLPHRFHVDLPQDLIQAVESCSSNTQVKEVGIEWCIAQSQELIQAGVPVLHYYTMSRSDNIHKIAKAIFY
ncbi:MAG: methylenetetrahydrofolate reductase [NAD(P)H] [Flavobacteriaceae bacterium]|nr:methylenetetrahydrofolate reductase [NAD(P)H] [Flavobacteriaceae bacterium]